MRKQTIVKIAATGTAIGVMAWLISKVTFLEGIIWLVVNLSFMFLAMMVTLNIIDERVHNQTVDSINDAIASIKSLGRKDKKEDK